MIVQFIRGLPNARGNYHLFLDNFFTTTKLGRVLRRLGVAMSGTAKAGSGFPKSLLQLRCCSTKKRDWGKQIIDVSENVLCLAWQDNNVVQFMTTGYSIDYSTNEKAWMDGRKRSGIPDDCKQKFAVKASAVSEDPKDKCKLKIEWKTRLPKPAIVDEYNYYMGGVDRFAQMKHEYDAARQSVKYWHALFIFLVEASVINAYRLNQMYYGRDYPNKFGLKSHRDFQQAIGIELILQHGKKGRQREAHVMFSKEPPAAAHQFGQMKKKKRCEACKENKHQRPSQPKRGKRKGLAEIDPNLLPETATETPNKRRKISYSQTIFWCITCKVPSCRVEGGGRNECWEYIHRHHTWTDGVPSGLPISNRVGDGVGDREKENEDLG